MSWGAQPAGGAAAQPFRVVVKPSRYYDSVFLMQLSTRLGGLEGVEYAAALMGTDHNKALLASAGLLTPEAGSAGPGDLIIAVRGRSFQAVAAAVEELERELAATGPLGAASAAQALPTAYSLEGALRLLPNANLAILSVPGRYAAREAERALQQGLHVMLFSDHVPLEEEIRLKRLALERGLLLMGPDCGTAVLRGVGLGFANRVPRGPVGLVGASGTGLQEVMSLLARAGVGISEAIGTGSRDGRREVGGLILKAGLRLLAADAATRVVVVVSKPPDPEVTAELVREAAGAGKPVVLCLLGAGQLPAVGSSQVHPAPTLEEAARRAFELLHPGRPWPLAAPSGLPQPAPSGPAAGPSPGGRAASQRYLRGLFTGGTLCYEALSLAVQAGLEEPLFSNVPLPGADLLSDPFRSVGHTLLDMGDDAFTEGRPHPMIDPTARNERLLKEAADPEVAVLLLDIVLGFGSHPDPVGATLPALQEAVALARRQGRELAVVASVCGTDEDPQVRAAQVARLQQAGVLVFSSNAQAARAAIALVQGGEERAGAAASAAS